MGLCKICKRPMPIGQTVHRSCLDLAMRDLQEDFCGDKCRWPLSCDEETLAEHCASCRLLQVASLAREVMT